MMHGRIAKGLGRIAVLALLLATGLARAAEHESRPPADRAPLPDEGIVLVSVTSNVGVLRQFDSLRVELKVAVPAAAKPPKPETWRLSQVSRGMARDTALFAGVMPAGEYVIKQLADDESTQYFDVPEGGRELIGNFTVEAGKTSDLGRLVMTPVNGRVLVGRSTTVTSNATVLRAVSPDNVFALDGTISAGWVKEHDSRDLAEKLALAEPIGASRFMAADDGIVVGVAKLGSILLRLPKGDWRVVPTGSLETLLCAARAHAADELLVAGGELNTLVVLGKDGKVRRVDTGDLPMGSILHVDGSPEAGWWLAHERGTQVTLYHSAKLEGGHWESLRSETTAFSTWSGARNFFIWPASGGLVYTASEGPLRFLDFATGAWTERKLPGGSHVLGFWPGDRDAWGLIMSSAGGLAGVLSSSYITRDNGQAWTKVSPPKKVRGLPPLPIAPGTIVQESNTIGWSSADQVYQVSRDNGKTWETHKVRLPVNSPIYFLEGTGLIGVGSYPSSIEQIWFAKDAAAEWELELTNYMRLPDKKP